MQQQQRDNHTPPTPPPPLEYRLYYYHNNNNNTISINDNKIKRSEPNRTGADRASTTGTLTYSRKELLFIQIPCHLIERVIEKEKNTCQ